jgi:hypothetical protein
MAFWHFVVFQDLRCLLRLSQLLLRTSQCIYFRRPRRQSRLSHIIYCFFSLKPASTVFPPNCHSNSRYGVTKNLVGISQTLEVRKLSNEVGILGHEGPFFHVGPRRSRGRYGIITNPQGVKVIYKINNITKIQNVTPFWLKFSYRILYFTIR